MDIKENVLVCIMGRIVFFCSLFLTAVISAAGDQYPDEVEAALRKAGGTAVRNAYSYTIMRVTGRSGGE